MTSRITPYILLLLCLLALTLILMKTVGAAPAPVIDCAHLSEDVAQQDPDNDGLNNQEECFWGTSFHRADTDADQYSDLHEIQGGYDPLSVTGMFDWDHDGITDPIERKINTDQFNPDTDGDGYSDGHEISHGFSPLFAAPNDKLIEHPLTFPQ